MTFHDNKEPSNVQIQCALLTSERVDQLKRIFHPWFSAGPLRITHRQSHRTVFRLSLLWWTHIHGSVGPNPAKELMTTISTALSSKFPRQLSAKLVLSDSFVKILFMSQDFIASFVVVFPFRRLALGKGLDQFLVNLVHVWDYCSHMLAENGNVEGDAVQANHRGRMYGALGRKK